MERVIYLLHRVTIPPRCCGATITISSCTTRQRFSNPPAAENSLLGQFDFLSFGACSVRHRRFL